MANNQLSGACRLIEQYLESGQIDGAGLAVWISGERAVDWYSGAAGPDLPASQQVLWPLASISKLYSAAAIMSLVEEGQLTLSMRLAEVIAEFDTDLRSDTRLWHLLTHTSGIIYESPNMEQLLANQVPLDEMIDEAFSFGLLSRPGDRFEYSDYGIALAARVAEIVTGKAFPDLVRERVIEPGGLTETWFPPPPELAGRIARVRGVPASGTPGEMYNSSYCQQLAHPSFGVVSSVRDLLKFGLLFVPGSGRRILSEASVRAMTSDQLGGGRTGGLVGIELHEAQPWGFGFMVRGATSQLGFGELASPAAFGHPGASGCMLLIDPVHEVALAFASNRHAASGFEEFLRREAAITNAILAGLTTA